MHGGHRDLDYFGMRDGMDSPVNGECDCDCDCGTIWLARAGRMGMQLEVGDRWRRVR
jgi:hypothetical protein